MRCNSTGELYPITTNTVASKPIPLSLAVVSPDLWHNRLGHPGKAVMDSLRTQSLINCNKEYNSILCHSCQISKHVRLPFFPSGPNTVAPFDVIHSDLWTCPINISTGFRYYLLLLDDFTNYLWIY
ncbi:unnamed protein product, partial [Cuscuta epithymum]